MGNLEKESRKRTRNLRIQKIVLGTIASAGILGIAMVAPSVLATLSKMGVIPNRRQKETIQNSRKRLITAGLVSYSKEGFLELTKKGERKLEELELRDYQIKKPKHWDKKWRILTFDIRENRRGMRHKIRSILVSVGFIRLQQSVWVYPHDCEDMITLLKANMGIGKDLLYIIADSIENDRWLKEHFELK